jgi:sarcosine oxidase subunit gamma
MTVKFDNVTPADISTPLSAANHSSDGLLMQELSLAGKICLRGDFSNASVTTAARETLGVSVELDANTFVRNGDVSAFWLGPDERMIFTDLAATTQQISELKKKLPGKTSVTDVSDYYTVIRLSGERVRPILASGTPLDLHQTVFRKGQCAQTRFGTASVMLAVQDDIPVIDLQVRWSFAEYTWKYLCKVANYC